MKYSPKAMNQLLENNQFHFKKNFGQNFIIDENIINNIIEKANILEQSLVIEIGPGAGSLTYKISKSASKVLCYEIDTKLEQILTENLKGCNNVDIIYDDFLRRNIKKDLENYEFQHLYVIANLPYYITTPIIVKLIEDAIPVDKIVVMVQKEVGNRFKAKPGSREYGSLSVYLNYYFKVIKLLDISRNVFLPKPNVDSIVVGFEKKRDLLPLQNETLFFQLVRDSFQQKRKTLKNNLKDYDLEIIDQVLQDYNLNLQVRAEQLSLDIFVAMANSLANNQ